MKNTKKQKKKMAVPRRNSCPMCGHKELLTEGPDQFCLSCDWDTCAEYVERGLMNNLGLAYFEHFGSADLKADSTVKKDELEKADAPLMERTA